MGSIAQSCLHARSPPAHLLSEIISPPFQPSGVQVGAFFVPYPPYVPLFSPNTA